MITPAQLRAARGMLDWTRSTLAKASGLSAETIKNIEHGIYTPQESTIESLIRTFAEQDLEFTEDDGIKTRKNRVTVFSGKHGYEEFFDHVYSVLKKAGGRIHQFNISDNATHIPCSNGLAQQHIERMSKLQNLDAKVLSPEGDMNFTAPYCKYKWLDKNAQSLIPYYIYNGYVAMLVFNKDTNVEIISIHSKLLSEKYAEQFNVFWESAKVPNNRKVL